MKRDGTRDRAPPIRQIIRPASVKDPSQFKTEEAKWVCTRTVTSTVLFAELDTPPAGIRICANRNAWRHQRAGAGATARGQLWPVLACKLIVESSDSTVTQIKRKKCSERATVEPQCRYKCQLIAFGQHNLPQSCAILAKREEHLCSEFRCAKSSCSKKTDMRVGHGPGQNFRGRRGVT